MRHLEPETLAVIGLGLVIIGGILQTITALAKIALITGVI